MPSSTNVQRDGGFSLDPREVKCVAGGDFDYDMQTVIETSQTGYSDYSIIPTGGVVNQAGPFHFCIEEQNREIDLNNASLYVKAQIVRANGDDLLGHEDIVAPINLLGTAMWDSIQVKINGNPFTGAMNNNLGYKAYIDTLLSYDQDSWKTHLTTQYFSMDSPGLEQNMSITDLQYRKAVVSGLKRGNITRPEIPADLRREGGAERRLFDDDVYYILCTKDFLEDMEKDLGRDHENADRDEHEKELRRGKIYRDFYDDMVVRARNTLGLRFVSKSNEGFYQRYHTAANSDPFDMYSPIPHDFFKMSNHLGPFNRVDITLARAPDEFILNSVGGEKYKLRLLDLRMHLHTIETKRNENREMIPIQCYHMIETQLHKYVVPAGAAQVTFPVNRDSSVMPHAVIFAMTTTRGADGAYNVNPFELYHNRLKHMHLLIGNERYPTDGLQMQFAPTPLHNSLVSHAYKWVFDNSGSSSSEKGNLISWNGFNNGSFVLPMDLTPDKVRLNSESECLFSFLLFFFFFFSPHAVQRRPLP